MDRVTRDELEAHQADAIHVITPTIEGREELLAECCESVKMQTIGVRQHVICDSTRVGPAVCRNVILEHLDAEWVAFLDDDDLMDEDHLETLAAAINGHDADLAFSWYRTVGATPSTERVRRWDDYAYGVMLGGRNLIPVTVLARREALVEAGGFRNEDRYEDYSLWMRMLRNGARVAAVSRETWTYRMLGGNRTWAP